MSEAADKSIEGVGLARLCAEERRDRRDDRDRGVLLRRGATTAAERANVRRELAAMAASSGEKHDRRSRSIRIQRVFRRGRDERRRDHAPPTALRSSFCRARCCLALFFFLLIGLMALMRRAHRKSGGGAEKVAFTTRHYARIVDDPYYLEVISGPRSGSGS